MKICSGCQIGLPLDGFYRDSSRKDGRSYRCKSCHATYQASPEVMARKRSYQRSYLSSPENLAKHRAATLAWSRSPPGRALQSTRDAVRRGAPGGGSPDLTWRTAAERDGMNCAYCGVLTVEGHPDRKLWPTLDHVVPVSRGGPHLLENAVLACWSCNSKKGNRGTISQERHAS